jgi:WD40 repeat protein
MSAISYGPDSFVLGTADTSGMLMIWQLEERNLDKQSFIPRIEARVHQSGVNCVSQFIKDPLDSSLLNIASGGDDQSITILQISMPQKSARILIKIDLAHSSSLRGVSFTSSGLELASTSSDKRVCIWSLDRIQSSANLKSAKIVDVEDVSCMDTSNDRIVVAGQGICWLSSSSF